MGIREEMRGKGKERRWEGSKGGEKMRSGRRTEKR